MGNKHVISWAFALAVTATVALAVPFGGGGAGFTPDQINGPISAFGVPLFAEITPITQQHFTYGIHPRTTRTLTSSGATVVGSGQSGSGSDAVISIDNAANAFAVARSFRALHYRPGIGQMVFVTAAFNAGVANSQQFAGAWSPGSGYFVGYNGATFGAFARTGGSQEVRTLTVSTAATSGANATVTVDGTAVTCALTNQTGVPERTAWELSQCVYSAAGQAGTWGWDAYARGAVVHFVARRARAVAGSFAYGAGTTGSAAAWATVRAGVAETDDFGSPASPGNWTWHDPLDGTGPSGLNINPTKGVIYGISYGHLGHRGAVISIMNPKTNRMIEVASYDYMNRATTNVMNNPTVYVAWGIVANGSTTAMTMRAGSGFGGLEGKTDNGHEGESFSVSSSKTGFSGASVHFLSLRNGVTAGFGGQTVRASRTQTHVDNITVGVNAGAAGSFVDVSVVRNPTYTNVSNFSVVDATRLALTSWQDTTTTSATVTSGTTIASLRVPTGQVQTIYLNEILDGADTLAVLANPSVTQNNTNISIDGRELQ